MKVSVWMPLYVGDYLADTMHLSRDEHGAYLLLVMAYWRNGGPLADDEARLQCICKASAREWPRLARVLRPFFNIANGLWSHVRIDRELKEASISRAKRTAAAMQRWCKADALHEPSPSPSPSPSKKEEPPLVPPSGGRQTRGSRLPADWAGAGDDWAFAEKLGLDPFATAAKFRDYWTAKPGAAGCKLDWSATWRNWCRREAENQRPRAGPAPSEAPQLSGQERAEWARKILANPGRNPGLERIAKQVLEPQETQP